MPEPWLRGPLPGVDPLLMPAAHALMQVVEDVERAVSGLSTEETWARPGGAASVGFHLRHLAGSTDRLLSYARGEPLTEAQMASLRAEGEPGDTSEDPGALLRGVRRAMDVAMAEYGRGLSTDDLLAPREVGRARLPTTLLGLLFHVAEHAQRHAGQTVTTAKIVRGLGTAPESR